MYAQNTILELKEPQSTEDKPFAYDRVRVVGPSPVDAGVRPSSWVGGDARGVIIEPLSEFGAFLDEPFGKLQALYTVIEVPEVEITPQKIKVIDAHTASAGQTPEEIFSAEAPGVPGVDGKRGRTPHSPLNDPREADVDGPLGPTPEQAARAAAEAGIKSGARALAKVGAVE